MSHPNTSHVVMTEGANVTSVLKDEIPIKVVEMLRRKEMLQKEEVMLREKVLILQEKATNKRRISLIDIV